MEKPTEGEIYYSGKALSEKTQEQLTIFRRRNVGFVFQSYNFSPYSECLRKYCSATGIRWRKIESEFVSDIISALDLQDKVDSLPSQLSGGQQQRVAIARALVTKPQIILADEPTGNLDSQTSADVMGLFKNMIHKLNQTLIMITHNEEIAQLADRMIQLEDGRIRK